MKFQVYLSDTGCEKVALGKINEVGYWEYGIVPVLDPYKTGVPYALPKGAFKLAELEVSLPRASQVEALAVEALKEKLRASYVEAEKEQRALKERIQNLLALPAPDGRQVLSERELQNIDDLSF